MPIEARTLQGAAKTFCDHLNHVLARTVTRTRLQFIDVGEDLIQVAFRQAGRPTTARLTTRFGQMELFLGQNCAAEPTDSKRVRLFTASYKYTLNVHGVEEPLFRWEYKRKPTPSERWCRHHVQGNVPLRIGKKDTSLNDLHLPTGYVAIEDVLRFCIVDLKVKPLTKNWHETLEGSYNRFKTEFAP